jgi:hypothetical protein
MTTNALDSRPTPGDLISGLMAMASIVFSALACGVGLLLELDTPPARMTIVATLLALVAARMSTRFHNLALTANVAAMGGFVVGMTIAVITEHTLI